MMLPQNKKRDNYLHITTLILNKNADLCSALFLEARAGIEPAHNGFADHRVTASPPSHRVPSY